MERDPQVRPPLACYLPLWQLLVPSGPISNAVRREGWRSIRPRVAARSAGSTMRGRATAATERWSCRNGVEHTFNCGVDKHASYVALTLLADFHPVSLSPPHAFDGHDKGQRAGQVRSLVRIQSRHGRRNGGVRREVPQAPFVGAERKWVVLSFGRPGRAVGGGN